MARAMADGDGDESSGSGTSVATLLPDFEELAPKDAAGDDAEAIASVGGMAAALAGARRRRTTLQATPADLAVGLSSDEEVVDSDDDKQAESPSWSASLPRIASCLKVLSASA